jgi:hypothetical protein
MRKMLGADGGMTLPPPIPMVPKAGLEPARACAHRPLKTACLPIPPLRHPEDYVKTVWTDRQLPPTLLCFRELRVVRVIGLFAESFGSRRG